MDLFEVFGYPLLAIAALQVYLGILLLRNNPRRSAVNRSIATFSFFSAAYVLSNAIAYLRASQGLDFSYPLRAAWVGWLSIPAALQFIHFLRDEQSRTARRIGLVLYPFWTAVLLLCLFTDLVEPGDVSLIPYVNRTGSLEDPLRIVGSLMILWVVVEIVRLRRHVTGVRRAQLNYFFHGTLIFAAGGALIVGFIQVFGGFGLNPALGAYFSLPWVAMTFYAITRHRLFDISVVVSRTLAVAIVSVLFFGITLQFYAFLRLAFGSAVAAVVTPTLTGFLFFATPLTQRLSIGIQHLMAKGRYDYQRILKDSLNATVAILDLNDLLAHVVRSIRKSFASDRVCLFLVGAGGASGDGRYYCEQTGCEEGLAVPDQVLSLLKHHKRAVLREEIETLLDPDGLQAAAPALRELDAELFVPIVSKGTTQGVLTVGAKRNGDPFFAPDIDLIETLMVHAAVAIENARLYDEGRRVKESLLQSEARFRAFAETTPAAIVIYQGGAFRYVNPAGESIAGYRNEDMLTMQFEDIVHPAYRDLARTIGAALQGRDRAPEQYEFKIVRKDGEERWVLMTVGRIVFEGRDAVIGTIFDITERKQLEGQLRVAQKMEAIGKLAGGVAHDFNNVLTTIVGHGSLLHMKMDRNDPLRDHVDEILASSERAAHMTQSLLAFGRKQTVTLVPGDLNAIVRKAEKLLAGLMRPNVRLVVRPGLRPLDVAADASHMERVIMNLAVNGRDAMPDGGTLLVETSQVTVDDEFIRVHGFVKRGTYAVLSVVDTGTGMDAQTKKKIFEPFFTTKGAGKGTGFGLSIVYEIVKQHRGYITVESEPGNGATFRVFLPLAGDAREGRADASAPGLRGTETILIADDDEGERRLLRAVLEGGGYRVLEAVDGEDAAAKFAEGNGGIALVILDFTMPKMNGVEALGVMRSRRPDVKTLFMSGYSEEMLTKKGLLDAGQKFILKPFSPDEMLQSVREAIAAGAA